MIGKPILTRVLLPERLFHEARDKEHLKELVLDYIKRYSNYTVKAEKDHMEVCEREV